MKHSLLTLHCLFLGLLPLSAEVPAQAQEVARLWTMDLAWENDIFGFTDRWYTNGSQITFVSPDLRTLTDDAELPPWAATLVDYGPFSSSSDTLYRFHLSLAQDIYTPRNLETAFPSRRDRPYAGWLRLNGGLRAMDANRMDVVEISLGTTGAPSLSRDVQQAIHVLIDSPDPQGWGNQIPFEPTLQTTWARYWKVREDFGNHFAFDMTPMAGATLGNIYIRATTGAELRFGQHLPHDYGTGQIQLGGRHSVPYRDDDIRRDGEDFGWHVISGFDLSAVGHNAFLDGTFTRDSASVDSLPYVANLRIGFALLYDNFRFSFVENFRSPEFEDQEGWHVFGSMNFGLVF